jgi:hypothetical protein
MPPSAPANDNAAMRQVRSLPMTRECLSSRATTKKNSVINPSLIQRRSERVKSSDPKCSPIGISQNAERQNQGGDGRNEQHDTSRDFDLE